MKTQVCLVLAASLFCSGVATALTSVIYGGNGTTPVDSGLPGVGVIYGVKGNGELAWYQYQGSGESDRSAHKNWHPNSGNSIGNDWQKFRFLLGCGDGVILAVKKNGDLLWYKYTGNGENVPSAATGWDKNSGNQIGNGWQNFRRVFVAPREGRESRSHLTIYAVAQNGDLLWYEYDGNGEQDPSGRTGWHANSRHTIGNGWQDFPHIFSAGGAIFAVRNDGGLFWYSYQGRGESDRSGWAANSGNQIGNGWQDFRTVFGGATDSGGFGQVIYAITKNRDLLWYRYNGNGASDPAGRLGWHSNSGNPIGNGW